MVRFLNQPNKDIGFSDESEYLEKQIAILKMKYDLLINICEMILMIILLIAVGYFILKEMNSSSKEYEGKCNRISINEEEDNCMCPCSEPTWIEKKLNLYGTCDGWIVKKNESCLAGVEWIEN